MDRATYAEACEELDRGASALTWFYVETDPEAAPADVRQRMAELAAAFGIYRIEVGSPFLRLQVAQRLAELKESLR